MTLSYIFELMDVFVLYKRHFCLKRKYDDNRKKSKNTIQPHFIPAICLISLRSLEKIQKKEVFFCGRFERTYVTIDKKYEHTIVSIFIYQLI